MPVKLMLCTISLFLAIASATHAGSRALDPPVDTVLKWLPANAQAIVVTNLADRNLFTDRVLFPMTESGMGWQLSFLRPIWALDGVIKGGRPELCIDCVLSGPERTADGGNASCHFLYLSGDSDLYESQLKDLKSHAVRTYTDSGQLVAELGRGGIASEKVIYWLCMPKSGLVIGATTSDAMHQVLERIQSQPTQPVALPDSLKEWTKVDVTSPCWGFRHFAANGAISPSSRFNGNVLDPKAIGIAFNYDPREQSTIVTYLSSNPAITRIANALAGIDENTVKRQPVVYESSDKGAVTMRVSNEKDRFPHVLWTSLSYWFGEYKIPDDVVQACFDRLEKSRR